ncbi:MAG TPA: hypothetical protein DIU15_14200 [Deltaproteobacteria bacterium]|nr:hypothetical protein [Deltaproteobacteria bacterium]
MLAGGQPQFAHPSDGSLSPLILSSIAFGETLGMKINIGLVSLFGTLGLFVLLRFAISVSTAAALVASVGYAWSGWLPARVAVGFYESCLVVAWPAILALWLLPGPARAMRRRWTLGGLLLWALAIQLQLALPVLVLLMGILWLATAVQQKLAGEGLPGTLALGGLVILSLAFLLGAPKFLPMLDFLGEAEFRETTDYPLHPDAWYLDLKQLWFALFHHVPEFPLVDKDGNPRIQEYMTLQPTAGVLLFALIGLPRVLRRSHPAWPWTLVTLAFVWLSFGPHAPLDAFRALRELPLFASMRGPLRYFNYPVLLGLCIVAAVGFDGIEDWLKKSLGNKAITPRALAAVAFLAILASLPVSLDSRNLYRSSFLYPIDDLPPQEQLASEGLRQDFSGDHLLNLRTYVNVRRGVPTIYTPEDIPLKPKAAPAHWLGATGEVEVEPEYRGEAWVTTENHLAGDERPVPGRAEVIHYRAQEILIRHDLDEPAIVVVNQNSWPGWTCGDRPLSSAIHEMHGLLAFEAPQGSGGQTTCSWHPRRLKLGLGLCSLGLLSLGLLWPWRRKEARKGADDA